MRFVDQGSTEVATWSKVPCDDIQDQCLLQRSSPHLTLTMIISQLQRVQMTKLATVMQRCQKCHLLLNQVRIRTSVRTSKEGMLTKE